MGVYENFHDAFRVALMTCNATCRVRIVTVDREDGGENLPVLEADGEALESVHRAMLEAIAEEVERGAPSPGACESHG